MSLVSNHGRKNPLTGQGNHVKRTRTTASTKQTIIKLHPWEIRNRWNQMYINDFGVFLRGMVTRKKGGPMDNSSEHARLTCEDSPLHLLIMYARAKKLPFRFNARGHRYDAFTDNTPMPAFENAIHTISIANDYMNDENLEDIDIKDIRPGDILVNLDESGNTNIAKHIQLVYEVGKDGIKIFQGQAYFGWWGNSADPTNKNYVGRPGHLAIMYKQHEFSDKYDYENLTEGRAIQNFLERARVRPRRFRFMSWNPVNGTSRHTPAVKTR